MIIDTGAYVFSLIQVLVCCLIRDFLIPLLVWKNYLKNRSYGYRFWFCAITQASLQINLVLLLGFFGISNRWTIIGFNTAVYLLIAWNFSDKKFFRNCRVFVDSLIQAYREERLIDYALKEALSWFKKFCKSIQGWPIWKYILKNWLEITLLATLIVYNIWFLTRNVMLYHSYQFSDIPVHQSWIYELEHGNLFSDGIYPFGMHAMVYIIRVIFRLNLREILLYAGAYQTVLMMMGLYLLAREIFHAKYTPVTVIVIISFMLNQSRYGASLPQEAGMYVVVGLAYFMIRYLHRDRKKFVVVNDSLLRRMFRISAYVNRRYIDSEAVLLMLCVALVIAYHFFTAIAAIFLVISIGLAYLHRIFKKQYFIPLMFCGIMGAFIAAFPLLACLAKGIPVQGSLNWAKSVIAGEEREGSDSNYKAALEAELNKDKEENPSPENTPGAPDGKEELQEGDTTKEGETENGEEKAEEEAKKTKRAKVDYASMTPKEIIQYYYDSIHYFNVYSMFGDGATRLMFICMALGALCAVFMSLSRKLRNYGSDYIAMLINMLLLSTIGASQLLGIVELIEAGRASTFAEPFIGFVYMLPVDFAFRIFGLWKNRYYQAFMNLLSAAICGGAAFMIVAFGWYHDHFVIYQSYYNEAEYVLRHIRQSYDNHTYTIVSTTDEYYDVVDYGYHTQLSKFIDMVNGNQEAFTFPSKYVFFFVEKRVLLDFYYGPVDVDLKYAAMEFVNFENTVDYYYQRAIIESQAYYWAMKFRQIYPRTFRVFYEDDIYVVYILEQNDYNPYDLRVDYLEDYTDVIKANGWDKKNITN